MKNKPEVTSVYKDQYWTMLFTIKFLEGGLLNIAR